MNISTVSRQVQGLAAAQAVAGRLIGQSQWFEFTPLPDDFYEFRAKPENADLLNPPAPQEPRQIGLTLTTRTGRIGVGFLTGPGLAWNQEGDDETIEARLDYQEDSLHLSGDAWRALESSGDLHDIERRVVSEGDSLESSVEAELNVFTMEYEHCGQVFTDEWSCACDSECPVCGKDITPIRQQQISGIELNIETGLFDLIPESIPA